MKKKLLIALLRIASAVAVFVLALWLYFAQPTFNSGDAVELSADSERLKEVVRTLSVDFHPRNHFNLQKLDECASYIGNHFSNTSGVVAVQPFSVSGNEYKNVSCLFDGKGDQRIIVGAHYDSYEDTPGADDNASGVAGLIELAYMLDGQQLNIDVELVAYSLEEPPFFATEQMGSYQHAKELHSSGVDVLGMITLEMIGYFSDEPSSQSYPMPVLRLMYPPVGNFIGVISRLDQRSFTKKIKVAMKGATNLPVYSINAPVAMPGIDFSDHRNYWEFGYQAVMVSDTAFYRNFEYHKSGDTWDRLDYEKMGQVVLAVYHSIKSFEIE